MRVLVLVLVLAFALASMALACSAHASIPDTAVVAVDQHPMSRWAYWAREPLQQRVAIEEPAGPVAPGAASVAGRPADSAASALSALAAASYPVRFVTKTVAGRTVIYGASVRDSKGNWIDQIPLLDTHVTLAPGTRTINEALVALGAELAGR